MHLLICLNDSSTLITCKFWNMTPTKNIPTKAGIVVNPTSHPPRCADTPSKINWYNFPEGGAAVSPTKLYRVIHVSMPIKHKPNIREHVR